MALFSEHSDRFLLTGLKEGNRQCFEVLFYRYNKSIYFVAQQYLKDSYEAEGVVQETFYKIWKYRESVREDLDFKPYLIRIARGIIFNQFKKRLNEMAYIENYASRKEGSNHTEEQIYFKDMEQIIADAVQRLAPKRKQIFELSRFKGLSNKEIAVALKISEKTVENQITSALKILRNFIRTA